MRVPKEDWCAVDVRRRKLDPVAVPTDAAKVCNFAKVYKARGLLIVCTMRLTLVTLQEDAASLSVLTAIARVVGRNQQVLVPSVAAKFKHTA